MNLPTTTLLLPWCDKVLCWDVLRRRRQVVLAHRYRSRHLRVHHTNRESGEYIRVRVLIVEGGHVRHLSSLILSLTELIIIEWHRELMMH